MSAPNTNIDKQKKRHRPSLFGVSAAVALGLILLIAFIVWTVFKGKAPQGADV